MALDEFADYEADVAASGGIIAKVYEIGERRGKPILALAYRKGGAIANGPPFVLALQTFTENGRRLNSLHLSKLILLFGLDSPDTRPGAWLCDDLLAGGAVVRERDGRWFQYSLLDGATEVSGATVAGLESGAARDGLPFVKITPATGDDGTAALDVERTVGGIPQGHDTGGIATFEAFEDGITVRLRIRPAAEALQEDVSGGPAMR
jgi:DNA-binding transcriptional ArsR family regulator